MSRMKVFLAVLAFLAMAVEPALAGQVISGDGNRGDANQLLTVVFNDSGATLTSGSAVIWDAGASDDTDPTDAGLGAWVTTTTTADSNLFAGIVYSDSIIDQGLGSICVYGPIMARYADTTDGSSETAGQALGTTTVAGQVGNGTGVGCVLRKPAGLGTADNERINIFVNPSNGE